MLLGRMMENLLLFLIQTVFESSLFSSLGAFILFRWYRRISPEPRRMFSFRNKATFYGEELSALRPSHKPEDNSLSAFRDCLFNISADGLQIGGRSANRNLRTSHAVVTGTHLSSFITAHYGAEN